MLSPVRLIFLSIIMEVVGSNKSYTDSIGKSMYYYRSYWTKKKDIRIKKINKILNEL